MVSLFILKPFETRICQEVPDVMKGTFGKGRQILERSPAGDVIVLGQNNVISRKLNNFKIFLTQFLKDENKEVESVFASHDFGQYGKNGIPLRYSRDKFVEDILETLKNLPEQAQSDVLAKFNLKPGSSDIYKAMKGKSEEEQKTIVHEIQTKLNSKRDINTIIKELPKNEQAEIYKHYGLEQNIGDIDGIAVISENIANSPVEQKLKSVIDEFYYNNEATVSDKKLKTAFDTIIRGFPEFSMTIGKRQHNTHIYSVDIHTLKVLNSALNNPEYKKLSQEDHMVTKLAILMHDFGKKGNVVTTGHADISKEYAEKILAQYDLPESVKERVLKQIENHHWYEHYSKGHINIGDVAKFFDTEADLTIAKIITKGDLEGVSPDFHRKFLCPGRVLTQEEFNTEFAKIAEKIHF